jgi:hypothetical protein
MINNVIAQNFAYNLVHEVSVSLFLDLGLDFHLEFAVILLSQQVKFSMGN